MKLRYSMITKLIDKKGVHIIEEIPLTKLNYLILKRRFIKYD